MPLTSLVVGTAYLQVIRVGSRMCFVSAPFAAVTWITPVSAHIHGFNRACDVFALPAAALTAAFRSASDRR
jgi:hypothetical protein